MGEPQIYLDAIIRRGLGIVVFSLTEAGNVGLYCEGFKDGRIPLGVGDHAAEAIEDARDKDLMRLAHPSEKGDEDG